MHNWVHCYQSGASPLKKGQARRSTIGISAYDVSLSLHVPFPPSSVRVISTSLYPSTYLIKSFTIWISLLVNLLIWTIWSEKCRERRRRAHRQAGSMLCLPQSERRPRTLTLLSLMGDKITAPWTLAQEVCSTLLTVISLTSS